LLDGFDFFSPKTDPDHHIGIGQKNVYIITFYPKITASGAYIVSRIKTVDQIAQKDVTAQGLAFVNTLDVVVKIHGIAHAEQARYRGDYQHIPATR
jgi:hypothetical protein